MKKIIFPRMGLAPRFRPSRSGRPGLPPRRAPALARRARSPRTRPTAPERACRVAFMRRRACRAAPPACPAPLLSRLHQPCHVCLPLLHLIFLSRSAAATAAAHACLRHRHAASPESTRPATTARRRPLHLASSTASTSRNWCSRQFAVVSLLRPEIPRRSKLVLAGAWLRADSPASLPLPPPFLAHEHRTASLSLPSTSSHHAMAGDASPAITHAAAPPFTAAAGFPSSLAHATGTVGIA